VPEEVKKRRLQEVIAVQREVGLKYHQRQIGKTFRVLIERDSSKSDQDFCGRNSQNSMCVFPKKEGLKPGDYVMVRIRDASSATLLGDVV
jgi:tRNA-2-methylthio-N6-dimethylallyladenosine synthase